MSDTMHPTNPGGTRLARMLWLAVPLALLACMGLLGASFVSSVHGHGFGRGHGFGHGGHGFDDPEETRAHITGHIDFFLDRLDATEAQRDRIVRILSDTLLELHALRERHREGHDEILDVFTAAEIDRETIETLRVRELAMAEQASRSLAATLADVAEVLTPEQRAELRVWAELWPH